MADYIGFNEEFKNDILTGEKDKTLRYNKTRLPEEGETVTAVISHDEGGFAKLQITNVYTMTAGEVISTNFDGHQNYESLEQFNERLNEYYDEGFTGDSEFHMVEFEVVAELD